MDKDLLLAIDNGTQSVRALAFDLQGNLLARAHIPITPYVAPQPGWAENDPDLYWDALCRACQQLWYQADMTGRPARLRERLAGVAVTAQRATVVNVGEDGRPLRPAIVWLDQRRTGGLKPVGGLWGLAFALSGMRETVAYLQAEAEANWIRVHQPEIWQRTHKYLFLSGYLTYRLTGRRIFRRAPFHHHLELIGWAETQIVTRFWIVAIAAAMLGVALALLGLGQGRGRGLDHVEELRDPRRVARVLLVPPRLLGAGAALGNHPRLGDHQLLCHGL